MRQCLKLEELCDIRSGGTPSRARAGYYAGDVPWAKIGDLNAHDGIVTSTEECLTQEGLEAIGNRLFPPGTLLLAMYGSVGKLARAGCPIAANQAILGIQVKDETMLSPDYLRHWLEQVKDQLVYGARGVTQQNISATIVRNLEIGLPVLSEQRRLAAVLDKADAIRRRRGYALRLIEGFAASAFQQLFGEADSAHHRVVLLGELAEIVSGVTIGRDLRGEAARSVPYLRVANVQDGFLNLDEIKNVLATEREVERYALRKGDVLLTEGGDPDKLGRGAVWSGALSECIHQNHVFRVRIDSRIILPEYAIAVLSSSYGKRYFLKAAKQTTGIASINRTQLAAFPMPLAPLDTQKRYASVVSAAGLVEGRLLVAANEAERLVDSLAQRAFRGEL